MTRPPAAASRASCAACDFLGVDLIKLLVYTSIVNGLAAAPLLFLIGSIGANRKIMGDHVSGHVTRTLLRLALVTMLIVVASAALTASS